MLARKVHMSTYYTGRRARRYNERWRTFNERTLSEALAMVDVAALRSVPELLERLPRVLDVACGTGILLQRLLVQVPGIEAYGVDGSEDMLAQASVALKDRPHVHLERVKIGIGEAAGLPYAQKTFDLITCTNALHDLQDPTAILAGLMRLLAPGGQLVVEDFSRREPQFLWAAFEWLLQRFEKNRVQAYTLAEAQSLSTKAGLRVARGKVFKVDWFWRAWVLRAFKASSEAGPACA
jgi:ubiquinone/menaquinone biosynthesis C-methylase UbiE